MCSFVIVFADVIGVEICGSLKNVLAIAAGIVEGLELGPNAMAALVAQVTGAAVPGRGGWAATWQQRRPRCAGLC